MAVTGRSGGSAPRVSLHENVTDKSTLSHKETTNTAATLFSVVLKL